MPTGLCKTKIWFAKELFTLGYIMQWVMPKMKTALKSTRNPEPWRRACPHCTQEEQEVICDTSVQW